MRLKATITGSVDYPDGALIVTFRKEKLNESMRLDAEIEAIDNVSERNRRWLKRIIDLIESVSGLCDETGRDYTPEEIKAGEVYEDALLPIVTAYFEARKIKTTEAEAKKEQSKPE